MKCLAALVAFSTLAAAAGAVAPATATIFRASGSAKPGETVLLTGDWPATAEVELAPVGDAQASPAWQRLHPAQVSSQSLKVTIPADWPLGAYACRVVGPTLEASSPIVLNQPDPWWIQGDAGAIDATPGGWLRVFGKALHFAAAGQVRLESDGKTTTLTAEPATEKGGYELRLAIPKDLPAASYAITVHNGFGGDSGWRSAGHVQIRPATVWKQDVFDVTQFTAKGAPHPADWTEVIKAAVAKAGANGGGIVYFPRGRYQVNEELKLPRFVTLKGEAEGLVSLYWPPRDKALMSLVSGGDDIAVEDLTLYTNGIHRDGIAGRNNLRVQRVRLRLDAYYRHDYVGEAHAVKPVTLSSRVMGAGIRISGDNTVMTDCDVYHSCSALEMYHTHGGIIARNRLDYGNGPMQIYGLSNVIIEDNDCSAASLWSSGIGISLYHEACASYHLWFARNHIRQNYGGDREAVTMDGHGTAYIGKVTCVAGTQVTLAEASWWGTQHKDLIPDKDFLRGIERKRTKVNPGLEEWHGITLYILDGRGAGQYRNVLAHDGRLITLDSPLAVAPNANSVVSIGKFQGRMLFVGNEFRDAGTSVQLYPPNCDSVVAENQMWRVESTNCGAELSHRLLTPAPPSGQKPDAWRIEPSWFNVFQDNHLWEGNGWGTTAAVLGAYAREKVPDAATLSFPLPPLSRGHIIRDNQLDNNASIHVEGSLRDVIVEHNTVQNVEQGVVVKVPGGADSAAANQVLVDGNRPINAR